eukprot:TRINITY_DN15184_c0_g1_i1.p1 TRINITY_DN15184_c0_g1~~TRINITY_DN15184_c0_g1_i1.p1  ORF type:complete len:322 (+),score=36.27 TRINITY_DN15184_c0_g1_i1:63-1028(+)
MAAEVQQQWKKEAKKVQPILQQLNRKLSVSSAPTEHTLAVNQLDAEILDKELSDILRSQFMKIFTFFKDDVIDRFQPEIDALLQVLVYRISIWSQERTYGQQLQNLKFKPLSIRQKLLYLLLSIGIPYLLKRFQVLYQLVTGSQDPPPNEVVRRIGRIERIYQFLSTLNFLLLLWRADYVSPIHRLLGMQQTYLRPQMARRVSFEYMNRQLVWNAFTEFMVFLVPIVPTQRISKIWNNLVYNATRKLGWASGSAPASDAAGGVCPLCLSPVSTPFIASCGDTFCYYCLKVAMMNDGTPSCPKCSSAIESMRRWNADTDTLT